MSSVLQAGPCVRSNQLDYDEDVIYKVRTCLPSASSLHGLVAHSVPSTCRSRFCNWCLANMISPVLSVPL
jgi:hypothetical protein